MRAIVTGGAGFIGSAVVAALRDHDVRVLDLALGDDIRDPRSWDLRGVDVVYHQAAKVGLGVDFADVGDYVDVNDGGTAAMLRAMHDAGWTGRIVLASSMVVYGEGRYRCGQHGIVPAPPRTPQRLDAGRWEPACPKCGGDLAAEAVPEDAPTDPRNVYAATKLHQEHLCSAYAREHPGCSLVALRYHNVYGPGMPRETPYAGVAAIFRSTLEAGRPPRVFEDGGQIRDFVHVRDVAAANVLAADGPPGAYNVCSGEPHTVGDMARALAAAMDGQTPEIVGGYRLGDVRHVFASPVLARELLGFAAAVGFDAGMREFARAPLRPAAS